MIFSGRTASSRIATPAPLSRKERNDLWLLRWLYPPLHSKSHRSAEAQAQADANKGDRASVS